MKNTTVRGTLLRSEIRVKGPNDLTRKALRFAGDTRIVLLRHADRMKNDPEYRDAFNHVIGLLSAKKGPVGMNVQLIDAVQAYLVRAL